MQTWTAVQDQAVKLVKEDPQAAAESIAVELGTTPDEVSSQLEGYTFLEASEQFDQYFSGPMGEALSSTAEFLVTQQEIDEASGPEVYAEAVYLDAVSQVGQ
jgi:taurine transport system substrate-binding protein